MEIGTIGLDLAKNVFQVHGISATRHVVIRKALRRLADGTVLREAASMSGIEPHPAQGDDGD